MEVEIKKPRLNLYEPKYNQATYMGRLQHFFLATNPFNLLVSSRQLENAKSLVQSYMKGEPCTASEKELWRAKYLMESAFHIETGEKMNILGRMSAQVPCNMLITGCMMTWYKTNFSVFMWQFINQSFNALVNYTNRSGDKPLSNKQIVSSYTVATTTATFTALGFKSLIKAFPPIVARFVPYTAVAAANCVNIPFMRYNEIRYGIPIFDKDGKCVGKSSKCAKKGIAAVVFSRIFMCTPGMILPPFFMEYLEKKPFLKRMPWLNMPIQVALVGFFLSFMTPMGCALFPQRWSTKVENLEKNVKEQLLKDGYKSNDLVYFNKGL